MLVSIGVADIPQHTAAPNTAQGTIPGADLESVLAGRLRDLRTTSGLTQSQMATAMSARGLSMVQSTIANIEAGHRPVRLNEAAALAAILGVDLAELVTDRSTDTEREHLHRVRVEAQLAVRSLEREAAERHKLLEEAQVLLDNTMARLGAAQRRLADLEGSEGSGPSQEALEIFAALQGARSDREAAEVIRRIVARRAERDPDAPPPGFGGYDPGYPAPDDPGYPRI